MKSVPIRGSVGSVIADSGVDMETDPTLPRIGTDFMTHKFETAPVPGQACSLLGPKWLN